MPPMRAAKTRLAAAVVLCMVAGSLISAAPATRPSSEPTGMHGKVLVGYQGWFAPQDPSGQWAWFHYGRDGKFEPGSCGIDLWPDVSELDPDERYPTAFRHADGSVASVFSSLNPKTVRRHFQWMREHGIDGAFLQRFGVSVRNRPEHVARVLANVRDAAGQTDRVWAVMYDLTMLQPGEIASVVMEDWKRLVAQERIREDRTYLRHRGKPVVAVWGIGFHDRRRYSLDECRELIALLKDDPAFGGNSVVLGVPYWWRELHNDAVPDPKLHELIRLADVVCPWSVGRLSTPDQAAAAHGQQVLAADLAWTRQQGLDYLPVVFPGFSWHNLRRGRLNQIPRRGGEFLWAQALAAKRAGAEMLYVAMFDEVDEGTAIFKVTNDPPVGASPFVTYEGLPPDHYLWLTGQIGRLLRGEIPATEAMPQRGE